MTTITDFHPNIQTTIRFLSGTASLGELAEEFHISKQAIHKKIQPAIKFLKAFGTQEEERIPKSDLDSSNQKIAKLSTLNQHLRRELILHSAEKLELSCFKSRVLEFFPTCKDRRLPALEKKQILDLLLKFKRAGGLVKEFAKRIKKSSETLSRWEAAYEKYGLGGLVDKHTRPKNFGNTLPLWVKEQLVLLFLKFPRWTPYQYHSHIRHNPLTRWYVSLPTIRKLKNMHLQRTEEEKQRLKKRWCFAPGSKVWTVDFTCILKTDHFKLQLLTVSDHRSRFLFPTALFLNTSTQTVIDYLEELFLEFGIPMIIKADNGPEFRTECKEKLRDLSVYLLNSPQYYGQFNGSHERINRTIKGFIDDFEKHQNLTRLVEQIRAFEKQYDYSMTFDYLEGRTPASVYFTDSGFTPKNTEIVTPYKKDGELRMKFTGRDASPVRLSMALILKVLPPRQAS